ncbi:Peptide transporter family 1 [Pseudolycoriella hygida]|uniref:Peptide transporter family 1 n=1 Tax=Pseudolycoriella hygida TaxID=35572 RepID=A0A9Q0N0E5_9DIPT|nr:Peptide transporter family 1 [Pseudolycoriella hygida]
MEKSVEKIEEQKLRKFPGAIPFILIICCIERYTANSIVAILVLYLNRKLNYDQSTATAIMHANDFLVYFFTVIGAIIGDSWWGAYKTISLMMVVYSLGITIVSVGAIEALNLPTIALTFIGLIIIAIGSGCVRPNLNAFGGAQYKLPEQTNDLKFFFSIQFFFMKCGSLSAYFLAPILRGDVKCFGMDDCYPLAFGVPSMGIFLSFVIFMGGTQLYIRTSPSGNMLVKVFGCIFNALGQKFKQRKQPQKSHWLDYAEQKHGKKLVNNTKLVLNVLVMFLPLPIYWSGFLLQNSRWVFQAAKTDGDIGWFVIKPDQMFIFNPILALIFFPICEYVLYPLLAKIGLKTVLQKMTLGGLLGAAGVGLSTIMEVQLQSKYFSILWLIPQYLLMVLSENCLYIANLNFAYTEAPTEMKSVITSFVFVTIAGGNLVVVFITGIKFFSSQIHEFLFFTILIFVDMVFFGFLATRYKYVQVQKSVNS